ncbi:MAG TPA: GWxTD domain-containing protein [Acidobacteriota bacterium]|nr:GWxTD domain-containing protein [Acidobacteriota bacterium]
MSINPNSKSFTERILLILLICFFGFSGLQAQSSEEGEDYYKKWLQQDVVYIITPEEKEVFLDLATPEEKDQFIEQFWRRRDTDPTTAINEAKEEHYRRIAYANENFHSGVAGWRTDRGMIYIRFGEPTGIEKYPEGGTYARKPEEGGGSTWVHPFEVWFYNHLPGVGSGIEIEFVDVSRTNEYRIATNSDTKDAHFLIPTAGYTLGEILGTVNRRDRVTNTNLGNPIAYDPATRPLRYRDYPMNRLIELYKLQSAPTTDYSDLQKIVSTRVQYEQLDFDVRSDYIHASENFSMVPVTLFIDNKNLTFEAHRHEESLMAANLEIYGQVETLGGRIAYTFEEDIERIVEKSRLESDLAGYSMFQKSLPLQPGRYKLSMAVKDKASELTGTKDHLLLVPKAGTEGLRSSSVILAQQVTRLEEPDFSQPFVMGQFKVVPAEDDRFSAQEQYAFAYFEVYNLALDQAAQKPSVEVEIRLFKDGEELIPWSQIEAGVGWEFDGDRLLVYKTIPFAGLQEGKYRMDVRVTDQVAAQNLTETVDFVLTDSSSIPAQ